MSGFRRWPGRRLARGLMLGLVLLSALPGPQAEAGGGDPHLEAAETALASWDLDAAQASIDAADVGPTRDVKQGVLYVFAGRYAEAEALLAAALASGELGEGSSEDEEAHHYLALARGSQRALEGSVTVTSPDGYVEAVFVDPKDALLAPYLFDAMASAREALGADLGVLPTHPVRFELLDDPLKLAMLTPLSTENIRTTGTVGVTKYRRIMMITPRVMVYGYGWIDTAVHEYVHYLLTMRTSNQAPVWLQEGLAKLLETRWRLRKPPPLPPGVAYHLHQAIVRDDLVTLEEMYPSVAMLPSQERAALAYAEVETMLGMLLEQRGRAGLETLLDRVAMGDDAKTALATAWGDDFDAFMEEWKATTRRKTTKAKEGPLRGPEFKDGEDGEAADEPLGDVFSHLGGGKARQHARLGGLLQGRGHHEAAAMQYEKARDADRRARQDPVLSRRLGKLYVELERWEEAVPLLQIAGQAEPEDANLAAALGRALLRSGDTAGAAEALGRAVRNNPFIPSIHCDLAEIAPTEERRAHEASHCRE
ncbi:peptidase MA family metallohydrolase [Paraliomyxa miuraensis]|uniref:peptidase MA family metallohydrolase n=1 Tax=Paraliomyxa miuraensis TaxID=376150 RepID=UPI00224CF7B0|nr:tetratricopeptide repeat protein [Paraliomyxa miuraensis]MCX4245940.1 peptidase MA family metallohydrolase [Paraliomyxa miuraensis]